MKSSNERVPFRSVHLYGIADAFSNIRKYGFKEAFAHDWNQLEERATLGERLRDSPDQMKYSLAQAIVGAKVLFSFSYLGKPSQEEALTGAAK